jgi:hypothetical protein
MPFTHTNPLPPAGLRVVEAAAASRSCAGLSPLALRDEVVHLAMMSDGTVAGRTRLGIAILSRAERQVAVWPTVETRFAQRHFAGLQPWEMLLRAQLQWLRRRSRDELLVAGPSSQFAQNFLWASDLGFLLVRGDAVRQLPQDWIAVRVNVQAALASLEAKRYAGSVIARISALARDTLRK